MKRILFERLLFPILCIIILYFYFLGTYEVPKWELTMLLVRPISYGLVIFSTLVIFSEVKKYRRGILEKDIKINYSLLKKRIIFLIIVFLYISFFHYLGFLVDSIILIFALMLFLKVNWKLTLIISIIFPLLFFIIFTRFLYVPLPWGILVSFQRLIF